MKPGTLKQRLQHMPPKKKATSPTVLPPDVLRKMRDQIGAAMSKPPTPPMRDDKRVSAYVDQRHGSPNLTPAQRRRREKKRKRLEVTDA